MSIQAPRRALSPGVAPVPRWPAGLEPAVAALLVLGVLALVVPMAWDWSRGTWALETQGHELLVAAISAWLVYRRRSELSALAARPAVRGGTLVFVLAMLSYLAGRIYGSFRLELTSLILLPMALMLLFKGWNGLRLTWFPFFFLLFAVPLPFSVVLAVTGPMKTAVSIAAAHLMEWAGYPIGRSGVIITIGQYQLLVNEACAGLQTMFVLEAMGLLYASLMNHQSALRNALLVLLVIPIAFMSNVVRVVVLSLITFHFGDAAGQGFLHGFAGMMLFAVALVLVIAVDGLLGRSLGQSEPAR